MLQHGDTCAWRGFDLRETGFVPRGGVDAISIAKLSQTHIDCTAIRQTTDPSRVVQDRLGVC